MTTIRPFPVWFFASLAIATTLIVGYTVRADAATPPRCRTVCASGGRTQPHPCRGNVTCLERAIRWSRKDRARLTRELATKTSPDVRTAIELASRISGVSFTRLWTISGCESGHDPYNVLGQYEGLFQLGRYHRSLPDIAGLNPFNPYVNAIHAALFIARNGEGQWSCRSDGTVHADG